MVVENVSKLKKELKILEKQKEPTILSFCVEDENGNFAGFIEDTSIELAKIQLEKEYPSKFSLGYKIVGIGIEHLEHTHRNVRKPKDLNTRKS